MWRYPILALEFGVVVLTRLLQIVRFTRRAGVIVLQRELLHGIKAPVLERALFWWISQKSNHRRSRVVFDVDDTIFRNRRNPNDRSPEVRVAEIARRCDLVLAGNEFLEKFFSLHGQCQIIPTTIDTQRYCRIEVNQSQPSKMLTIGWTGAEPNLSYVKPLGTVLEQLQCKVDFAIRVISESGKENPFSDKVRCVELLPWNEKTEIEDLSVIDIGIMPLPDDDWTRGKCGFKLLQYMALNIAAVASPVGVNSQIIQHGVNGLLAGTPEEWERGLHLLLTDTDARTRLARNGRDTVEKRYASALWYPKWRDAILGRNAV